MPADLVIIFIFCLMGLAAHGSRNHPWMEWTLRVIYCFSVLAEAYTVLFVYPSSPETATAWTTGVVWAMAIMTALMLFEPFRAGLSHLLTAVNQLISCQVFVAALKKPVLGVDSPFATPPLLSSPTSTAAVPEAPSSATVSPEPAKAADNEPKMVDETAIGESETTIAGSADEADDPDKSAAFAADAGISGGDDPLADSGKAAAGLATDIITPAAAASPLPKPQPNTPMGRALAAFTADRVFVAQSVPHLNALWIYVTVLGSLLANIDLQNFKMPSISLPFPVPIDALLSYNFLGLVVLSACGAGIFVARKPKEVLKRLGIVKPSAQQVFIGLAMVPITFLYDYLWSVYTGNAPGALGDKLATYNAGTFTAGGAGGAFIIALLTGMCAGIGEETLIRGGLQPVFGIFPAAFLHGALHGQFAHAPLLIIQVAGWSTLMGIVRKYTNTTTTIITHVTFNFLTTFLFAFNP